MIDGVISQIYPPSITTPDLTIIIIIIINNNNNNNNDKNNNNNTKKRDQEILGWCPKGHSLIPCGERSSLALVGNPSRDGVSI